MLFIMRNTLQGLGRSVVPTLAGAAELFMRVFAALIMVRLLAYPGACSSEPLAWLGSCAVLLPAYIRAVRELRQRARDEHTGGDPIVTPVDAVAKNN